MMKKLMLAIFGVSIVLIGSIAVLNVIPWLNPCNKVSGCCATQRNMDKCNEAKESCKNSEQAFEKKKKSNRSDSTKNDSVRIKVRHPL